MNARLRVRGRVEVDRTTHTYRTRQISEFSQIIESFQKCLEIQIDVALPLSAKNATTQYNFIRNRKIIKQIPQKFMYIEYKILKLQSNLLQFAWR